ncbi:MAG: UvrD-helicase domain-containing protein [Acidobacteria bacterium]|nr:UvrD-helicase domain-containing protein [Acidobacteriota bacterium]
MIPRDAAARERALDAAGSFIVQAPAGSGKTELLTQRFLALLARVERPEAVAAITFTKKAAGEMRERILEAMDKAAGRPPAATHEAVTWRLGRAVLEQDRRQGWNLRQNPARLQVHTIDALCASLVRQMPWLSRLGAQPSFLEDASELYEEAARETLALLESDAAHADRIAAVLRHVDNRQPELERLIVEMLARRDQWLRHTGASGAGLRAALEHDIQRAIRMVLERVRPLFPARLGRELAPLARFAAAHVEDGPIASCAGLAGIPGTEAGDLDQWLGLAELLLKRTGDWRVRYSRKLGFPKKGPEKSDMERLAARLALGPQELRDELHGLRGLPPPYLTDEQWEVLEAIIAVLNLAAAQLRLVFRIRQQIDFCELAHAALEALGTDERPTDLAFALDCRIQHLLVDEFQDTSVTQWELLRRLTREWTPGDGRTLFLVGDPMQSIFRFREAEVALFLQAWERGLGQVRLKPLRLEVNFRSQPAVIDWINGVFAGALPERPDELTGAVPYSPSVAARTGADARVEMHPLLTRSFEPEAELVLGLVNQLRAERSGTKIAVLVRARTHCAAIAARLRAAGVRFQAVEIDELSRRQTILDAGSLARALVHLGDRTSWLAVLRAPWCGLTLADLHALVAGAPDAAVWDLLREEDRLARLSEDGRARVARLAGVIGPALEDRNRLPLRRWIEGVWLSLGGPACLRSASEAADVEAFFTLVEEAEQGGDLAGLDALEPRVAKLYATPDLTADDSLQILTIHKAKGLEFDAVIVPGLGRGGKDDDPPLLAWLEYRDGLLLAPVKATGADRDPLHKYLTGIATRRARIEDARLLYVAATRARSALHLIGHVGVSEKAGEVELHSPAHDSLLKHLWEAVRPQFEQALASRASEETPAERREPRTLRRLAAGWTLPAPPPGPEWERALRPAETRERITYEWAGDVLRHVGTAVHRILQRIGAEGLDAWPAARVAAECGKARYVLAQLGVSEEEIDDATESVRRAVEQTLRDERGRWILAAHREAACEQALTGCAGAALDHAVIDRTFIDEAGVRWIIDYKTGTHEGADINRFLNQEQRRYRQQMDRYASLFARLETRPVRCGLYFPLVAGWREWGFDAGTARAAGRPE